MDYKEGESSADFQSLVPLDQFYSYPRLYSRQISARITVYLLKHKTCHSGRLIALNPIYSCEFFYTIVKQTFLLQPGTVQFLLIQTFSSAFDFVR